MVRSAPLLEAASRAPAALEDVPPPGPPLRRPPLSRFVQAIRFLDGITPHRREKVLPNGVVEVILIEGARRTGGAAERGL